MERDLESLFTAFRERGDVGALAQVFDATSDELMTVALHLVGDAAQAEDLVQATFLTAIQRAETFDAQRALTPWLVGILANQAARSRAERARGVDATRIETRVQPGPPEEIERAEVAQILARAVDDLPEPYRGAVKRHVIDGERAVDIARQSGIAQGLAPGVYRLELESDPWSATPVTFTIVAGAEIKVQVPITRR
jgi:RNA polymerase sigma-70 factor (ECF subfamily)